MRDFCAAAEGNSAKDGLFLLGMKKRSQRLLIVFVAVIFLFIWVNSMFPAELSSKESGWVQRLLRPSLDFIYSGRLHASLDALAARLPEPLGGSIAKIKETLEGLLTQGPTYLVRKVATFRSTRFWAFSWSCCV